MDTDEFDFPDDFATAGDVEGSIALETSEELANEIALLLLEQNAVDPFASRLARPPPPKVELSAAYVEDIRGILDVYNTQEKPDDILPLLPSSRLPASLLNTIYTTYHSPVNTPYLHHPGGDVFRVHSACGVRGALSSHALLTGKLPCVARVAEITDWLRSALNASNPNSTGFSPDVAKLSTPVSHLQSLQLALRVSFNFPLLESLLVVLIARRARAQGLLNDPSLTSSPSQAVSPSFSGQKSAGGIPLLAPPPLQEASAVVGGLAKATRALTTQESLPKLARARKADPRAPVPAVTPSRLRDVADGVLAPLMAFLSTLPRIPVPQHGTSRDGPEPHLCGVAGECPARESTGVPEDMDTTSHGGERDDVGNLGRDTSTCVRMDNSSCYMGTGLRRGVEGALVEMCVAALAEQRCEAEEQCLDLLRHTVAASVAECADTNATAAIQNSSSTSIPPPVWVPVCGGWVGDHNEGFQLCLSLAGAAQRAIEEYCETKDAKGAGSGDVECYRSHNGTCNKDREVACEAGQTSSRSTNTSNAPNVGVSNVNEAKTSGVTSTPAIVAENDCRRLCAVLYRAELLAWQVDADGADESVWTRLRTVETDEEENEEEEGEEGQIFSHE